MPGTAFVYHPDYQGHDTGGHPEGPARVAAVAEVMSIASPAAVEMIAPEPATPDQIRLVHSGAYVERIRELSARGGYVNPDTVITTDSYDVALLAVGGAVRAVQAVLSGEATNAFAAVRPPGHHAMPALAMGFCFFNNLAIAIRQAQRTHGLERVMIVDFDVHHGNGTQATFEEDPTVLLVSVHEHPLFPGTGLASDTGRGRGQGYTVNIPLPAGVGDEGYESVFDELIAPIARRFEPQVIVCSAGYDAHWLDPLALMEVSVAGFAAMATRLRDWADELCGGRLALVLEGGYHLQALSASVLATVGVLANAPVADPIGPSRNGRLSPDVSPTIAQIKHIHRSWFS